MAYAANKKREMHEEQRRLQLPSDAMYEAQVYVRDLSHERREELLAQLEDELAQQR